MPLVSRITTSCFVLAFLIYLVCNAYRTKPNLSITASSSAVRRSILRRILSEEHHFVPALDHKLHYVGRWVATPNQLRWDTAFSGAHIELVVRNASIIYISLNNAPPTAEAEDPYGEVKVPRMAVKPLDDRDKAGAPVALMITLCNGNIIHFASSEDGLVAINLNTGQDQADCLVRISHAGGMSQEAAVLQFKGVWLPTGASLRPQAQLDDGRARQLKLPIAYRKNVELLVDSLEHLSGRSAMCTVEWLAQVVAHFDADQVKIPVHDHCLTEACTRILALDISTKDVFFRSGPAGSTFYARPWNFNHYVPDVLVLDLGTADYKSFLQSSIMYANSHIELHDTHPNLESITNSFITSYVALIQQIRRVAYPLHPSARDEYALDGHGYTYNSAPSTLPIFVMRPLDGSLEQATLSVVEEMQKDGDKNVFWIDTSGWLSEADYIPGNNNQQVRLLTATGHAKVASFMVPHLCLYLEPQFDKCPFLKRDNYMGSVYVPIEAELDKMIEESKIKKLRELFWT